MKGKASIIFRLRKYPERAKGLGIGEIKAGHEHRLLFSKVYCWSLPQQKRAHEKKIFMCP
ncbi:MAG: hypothetical protein MRZ85_00935 [Clostridium sp.]|nr:hypothetical protein [Clostridium sp.]MDD6178566.1 hypothetical protein [Clostridium sp.]